MTTLIKKMSMITIGLGITAVTAFSMGINAMKNETNVEAATVETKRVWINTTEYPSYWYADGAVTGIHYWGTSEDFVKVVLDSANSTWYYDIPSTINEFQFLRIGPLNEHWDFLANQTYGSGTYWLHTDASIGYDAGAVHATTTTVSNFSATLDTIAEACSSGQAEAAVNAYNSLATFEQDQFDALEVTPGVTGLQRLNYLRTFYNISTTLNVTNVDSALDDKSVIGIVMVGIIGLTTIGCFYFLTRKNTQD